MQNNKTKNTNLSIKNITKSEKKIEKQKYKPHLDRYFRSL